ncbi:tyrosine-type recombinase/integrase [Aquimarina muelleri]|uniref:tyrosine-type recombinase/integrase n=1 Tax=Aquimarina muelleri TaxID=279356 RepID=UPI003F6891D9
MKHTKPFLSYLKAIGYTNQTIRSKRGNLHHFTKWIADKTLLEVTDKDIKKYYHQLFEEKPNCKIRTLNKYILTLDQFYDWCCLFEHIQQHPFGNLTLIKNNAETTRKPIDTETIKQLYKACSYPVEKLLLIFGYGCGLRAAELQHLKVKDIHVDRAIVIVQSGKLGKRRSIPLQYKHIEYVKNYILHKNLKTTDYLFRYEDQIISQYLLRKHLKALQKRIGLSPCFSLHHLRHSIASHLVDNGVAIQLVQQFLGHSSLETTQNYVTLTKTISHGSPKTMGRTTL